ncbi:unnamed protein product [Phyllotreta striolata]|uniref:J domain-containing protein n=1 Tax=Phyllotreta striolata TaxID=444603 RepID=A0A9N9XPT7_PHYSR|nr:unnamed protein product [Phyllotreta striolata]
MYIPFNTFRCKPFGILISKFSTQRRTHYDILNLPKHCTTKQIKDSFIKLSKENHPDVNKSKNAHKAFLDIKEAYNVLSNPETRRGYDLTLTSEKSTRSSHMRRVYRNVNPDSSFYEHRNKSEDKHFEKQPYYGIKGQKRVSNLKIVVVCMWTAIVAVCLQFYLISNSFTLQRELIQRRSEETEKTLSSIRKNAMENGNEVQLEILKAKFSETSRDD